MTRSTSVRVDTRSAVTSINALTRAVDKNKVAVIEATQKTKEHKKATKEAIASIEATRKKFRALNEQMQHLPSRLKRTNDNLVILKTVTGKTARTMGALRTQTIATRDAMSSVASKLLTFNERLATSNQHLRNENRAMERSVTWLRKFNAAIRSVVKGMDIKNNVLRKQTTRVDSDTRALRRLTNALFGTQDGVAGLVQRFANLALMITVITAIHRGVLRLTQGLIEATGRAKEVSLAIAEIRSISKVDLSLGIQEWQDQLQGLATTFGSDILENAEGAYQALSNQVVNAAETQLFLRQEIQLSIVAATDLATAVQATTAVINAWKLSTAETAEVNKYLLATVIRGRTRLEDFANTIGRVGRLSHELGISFDQILGAYALITRSGIPPAEALTSLRGIVNKLIKPTEAMLKLFETWGVTSGAAAIKTFGFAGVLEKLDEHARQSGDAMAEFGTVFNRVRALTGKAVLTAKDFNKEMVLLKNATLDYDKATKDSMDAYGRRFQIQTERVKAAFLSAGDSAQRHIVDISESYGGLEQIIGRVIRISLVLVKTYISIRSGIGAYTVAIRLASLAQVQAGSTATGYALALSGLRTVFLSTSAAIGLLTAAVTYLILQTAQASAEAALMGSKIQAAAAAAGAALQENVTDTVQAQIELYSALGKGWEISIGRSLKTHRLFLAELTKLAAATETEYKDTFERISEIISDALESPFDRISDKIRGLDREISALRSSIADTADEKRDRLFDSRGETVRASLEGEGERERLRGLSEYSVTLFREAEALHREEATARSEAERTNIRAEMELRFAEINRLREEQKRIQEQRLADAKKLAEEEGVEREAGVRGPIKGFGERLELEVVAALKDLEEKRVKILEWELGLKDKLAERDAERLATLKLEKIETEKTFTALEKAVGGLDSFDIEGGDIEDYKKKAEEAKKLMSELGFKGGERLSFSREIERQIKAVETAKEALALEEELKVVRIVLNAADSALTDSIKERVQAETAYTQQVKAPLADLQTQLTVIKEIVAEQKKGSKLKGAIGVPTTQADLAKSDLVQKTGAALSKTAQDLLKLQLAASAKSKISPEEVAELEIAFRRFIESAKKFDEAKISGESLRIGKDSIGEWQTLSDLLGEMERKYKGMRTAVTELEAARDKEITGVKTLGDVKAAFDSLSTRYLELNDSTVAAVARIRSMFMDVDTAVQSVELRVRNIAKEIREATVGARGAGGANFGGTKRHFNFGGQGSDRISAYLRDGETVFTRQASQSFAPLIGALESAAGAGFNPGGSSVTFGDIHMTVPTGSSEDQVQYLVDGLRRHARRGFASI